MAEPVAKRRSAAKHDIVQILDWQGRPARLLRFCVGGEPFVSRPQVAAVLSDAGEKRFRLAAADALLLATDDELVRPPGAWRALCARSLSAPRARRRRRCRACWPPRSRSSCCSSTATWWGPRRPSPAACRCAWGVLGACSARALTRARRSCGRWATLQKCCCCWVSGLTSSTACRRRQARPSRRTPRTRRRSRRRWRRRRQAAWCSCPATCLSRLRATPPGARRRTACPPPRGRRLSSPPRGRRVQRRPGAACTC